MKDVYDLAPIKVKSILMPKEDEYSYVSDEDANAILLK